MRVSVLNTWDNGGGAARAAFRLASQMREVGTNLTYFVRHKSTDIDWVVEIDDFLPSVKNQAPIQSTYIDNNRTSCSNTYFSHTQENLSDAWIKKIAKADIINIHWVERFLSSSTIAKLAAFEKPLVWTLHDQRPLTGGCHYTSGCKQYIFNTCRNCIQLTKDPEKLPFKVLAEKIQLFKDKNITIVSPSKWLGDDAKASELFRHHRVEVIPNSIETNIFKPSNMKLARARLGLPEDEFIFLFGAQDTKEKRKGYHILQKAMEFMVAAMAQGTYDNYKKKIGVLIFGTFNKKDWPYPVNLHLTGTVDDDVKLADIYSAANCFVIPSLEDNLPNTILESLACGTPVIGFDTGGIRDMVVPNQTGYLPPIKLPVALYRAMEDVFEDKRGKLDALAINGVDLVRTNFNQKKQADAYLDLYDDLGVESGRGRNRIIRGL